MHSITPLLAVLVSLVAVPFIILCRGRPNAREVGDFYRGRHKAAAGGFAVASGDGGQGGRHHPGPGVARRAPGL